MDIYSSLRITAIEKPLLALANFVGLIAISRLLSPDEIGVQVLAASVMMLAAELKNFGIGSFLIRHKNLTEAVINNTFTLATVTSFTLALVLLISSNHIGCAFNDERVAHNIQIISVTFFFVPYVSVITALLSKHFKFGKLAVNRVCEVLTLQLTTVFLIVIGLGYLSLPLGILVANLISFLLFIFQKPKSLKLKISFDGVREIFSSNMLITLSAGLRRLIIVLPEILIGFFSSSANAALFSRGVGLVNFGTNTVLSFLQPLIAPYFARENNSNNELSHAFSQVNRSVGMVIFPLFVGFSLLSPELINIFFGVAWLNSVEVTQYFAIAMLFKYSLVFFNELLVTSHKEKDLYRLQIFELILTTTAVITTAFISWRYIALGLTITNFIVFLTKAAYLQQAYCGLFWKTFKASFINYVTALILIPIVLLCKFIAPYLNILYTDFIVLFVSSGLFGIIWLFIIFFLEHPLYVSAKKVIKG